VERLDKNVTKNIAIIVLVIFLGFSIVLNVFFVFRNQALLHQDNGLVYFGGFHRNQTIPDFQFKPFNDVTKNPLVSGVLVGVPVEGFFNP
jgi:hypothetical protein